jgi:hypothetical protein
MGSSAGGDEKLAMRLGVAAQSSCGHAITAARRRRRPIGRRVQNARSGKVNLERGYRAAHHRQASLTRLEVFELVHTFARSSRSSQADIVSTPAAAAQASCADYSTRDQQELWPTEPLSAD